MIKAKDAIKVARSYIGTPYSQMDCINLIIAVIRNSAGGVKDYRCQGTNWLWDSVANSGKYQHLTSRQESLIGAKAGRLAFKRYGADAEDHVGIVTGEGTIIHSSSVNGRGVVETPLTTAEGWDLLGTHRYIEVADGAAEREGKMMTAYQMQVRLIDQTSTVNVRNGPSLRNDIIGRLGHGAKVTVQAESDGWAFVTYGDSGAGYVSAQYLALPDEPAKEEPPKITIIDSENNRFEPKGDWRVLIGSVD